VRWCAFCEDGKQILSLERAYWSRAKKQTEFH
jgi:hypothetical protein